MILAIFSVLILKNRWTINCSGNKFLKISNQALAIVNSDRKFGSLNIKNKIEHMSQQTCSYWMLLHLWALLVPWTNINAIKVLLDQHHHDFKLISLHNLSTNNAQQRIRTYSFIISPETPWTNAISTICGIKCLTPVFYKV